MTRPNVILIAMDDMNDWVGCLGGHPRAQTPHIDRLAGSGTLFANAHCCTPLCGPSRTALLFGRRPSTTGIWSNRQDMRRSPVLADAVTLPQYLKSKGYETTMAGKVADRLDPDPPSWTEILTEPTSRTLEPGQQANPYRDWTAPPAADPAHPAHVGRALDVDDEAMPDARWVRWTAEYLQREHEAPFFVGVGMTKPHVPWDAPQKYFDLYPLDSVELPAILENDLDDVPDAHRVGGWWTGQDELIREQGLGPRIVQSYLASLSCTDAAVGRLLDALRGSRYAANTIVVLWSDHGHHFGEKEHWGKATLWDDSTRFPLIISGPGVPEGVRCSQPVDSVCVYPTLVELCGLPVPGGLDGRSLTPLFTAPDDAWDYAAITTSLGPNHGFGPCHSVRTQRWRYTRYADGSEELYDHREDPHEWHNLLAGHSSGGEEDGVADPEHAAVKAELADLLPRDMPVVPFWGE